MKQRYLTRGVTLVEVLVAISIIATMVVAIGFSVQSYVSARSALLADAKTVYLAEEGQEIIRATRDTNWATLSALSTSGTHYLALTNTTVGITTTPEVVDTVYSRSFTVSPVYRNSDDDIVASNAVGATIDTGSKEITVTVTGPNGPVVLRSILTNIHAI